MGKPSKNVSFEMAKEAYEKFNCALQAADSLNISRSTLHRVLLKQNYHIKRKRKYDLNEHCFDELTEETMYWLGFIATDGCLTDSYHLKVSLWDKDKPHLEKLQKFLKTNAPITNTIKEKDNKKYYGCSITVISKLIYQKLKLYNFTRNKTYTYSIPDEILNHPNFRHFIRGCFDGDGWIKDYRKDNGDVRRIRFGLCGASNLVPQIYKHLIETLDLNRTNLSKLVHTWSFEFQAHHDTYKLYNYLYDGATVWLDRKKEKADLCPDVYEKSLCIKFTDEEIINFYKENNSISEAAEKANCSAPTIKSRLRSAGLIKEVTRDKYNDYFSPEKLSKDSFYWAGHIAGSSHYKYDKGKFYGLEIKFYDEGLADKFISDTQFKINKFKSRGIQSIGIRGGIALEQLKYFNIGTTFKDDFLIPDYILNHPLSRYFILGFINGKWSTFGKELRINAPKDLFFQFKSYFDSNISKPLTAKVFENEHDNSKLIINYACNQKKAILDYLNA